MSPPDERIRVLVVDDDEGARTTTVQLLATANMRAVGAATAAEARRLQAECRPAVALIDFRLPDQSGLELAALLKEEDEDIRVVLVTGHATMDSAVASVGQFDEYLTKPVPPPALLQAVVNALDRHELVVENRALVERLQRLTTYQALYDPLTGLPNRALLDDRLSSALSWARRNGRLVAVLFVDLDGFKLINDMLGHHVGDELLREIAGRLSSSRRASDTVSRFGGDEFVVVCPDISSAADACRIAEELLASLADPAEVAGGLHRLTASIGIALAGPKDAVTGELLVRNADTAMYRAKDRGRGRWELYDDAMHDRVVARFQIERGLYRGLEEDELFLEYQPLVHLETGATVGAEALLRWARPGSGVVLPGEFLGVAEETGLAVPMGTWVLEHGLAAVAAWREDGRVDPSFRLWLNVSPQQIADTRFVGLVGSLLQSLEVPGAALGIEIVEEALHDLGATVRVLRALREMEVALNLDDFGAGHSNLSWLQDLPITGLKIDRQFIVELDRADSRRGPSIVRGMVELAHALELAVVGEGVETAAQAAALGELGCEVAQGYHFGRPGPPSMLWATSSTQGQRA